MLDTSRNYFTVEAIKRTLIGMAHSKLNRFHWHISDSQSFPYVSKAYPQLAQYGAYSSREIYTADDIKEIAEFARVRGIQVKIILDLESFNILTVTGGHVYFYLYFIIVGDTGN